MKANISTGGLASRAYGSTTSQTERIVVTLAWIVLGVAMLARLSPLLDIHGRIFWQYMTEDGYLMQTVARNMAIGLGMSTADGTIPTNGVQPLATYLFAALHWLAGGERTTAITLVTLVSAFIAAAGAYVFYRLAARILGGMNHARTVALVATAVWFSGSLTIAHSMNGLETGLYVLAMLVAANFFFANFNGEASGVRWSTALQLGGLLGITFLARNDAVFFIAALLVTHLLAGSYERPRLTSRLIECIVAGVVSIVIGLPWLINNYVNFGGIVPISGVSQSFAAGLGDNLKWIPANLIEVSLPFSPIPRSLEATWPVVLVGIALVPTVLWFFWTLVGHRTETTRRFTLVTILFGTAITLYYGLFFGAPHFIPRYLSILSPLLWLMVVACVVYGAPAFVKKPTWLNALAGLAMAAIFLEGTAVAVSNYRNGTKHQHRQVIDWMNANVEPNRWTGAVQTGTLGYFHDKTLNLDGKVNPTALHELIKNGNVFEYIMASPIDYIIDWAGVGRWLELPQAEELRKVFALELIDDEHNLSVMKRKTLTPLQ
jgi:hypothetical protein